MRFRHPQAGGAFPVGVRARMTSAVFLGLAQRRTLSFAPAGRMASVTGRPEVAAAVLGSARFPDEAEPSDVF
jgi:hypothetical protein